MTDKKRAKLMIATPMYGGMCSGEYTRSCLSINMVMNSYNVDVFYAFMYNNSLIPSARNQLASIFLSSDATHMMFIDADIKFEAMDIWKMMCADKDVIAGIYPKKQINWGMVHKMALAGAGPDDLKKYTAEHVVDLLNHSKEQVANIHEPMEVFGVGTGFMLIKRRVFENLIPVVDTYIDGEGDQIVHDFFKTMKDPGTGRHMSEDYGFCHVCRENGIQIYAAPWVKLGHVGSYLFEGSAIPVIRGAQHGAKDAGNYDQGRDGRVPVGEAGRVG